MTSVLISSSSVIRISFLCSSNVLILSNTMNFRFLSSKKFMNFFWLVIMCEYLFCVFLYLYEVVSIYVMLYFGVYTFVLIYALSYLSATPFDINVFDFC